MKAAKRYSFIVFIILAVLLVGGLALAAMFHVLLDVLYIFLILLALLIVGATLFQIYSIIMLMRTIRKIREEMKPLLNSLQETMGIMKGTAQTAGATVSTLKKTAKMTSEVALAPIIHTIATVVAIQGMARIFLGKGHARTRMEQRREQQLAAIQEANGKGGN